MVSVTAVSWRNRGRSTDRPELDRQMSKRPLAAPSSPKTTRGLSALKDCWRKALHYNVCQYIVESQLRRSRRCEHTMRRLQSLHTVLEHSKQYARYNRSETITVKSVGFWCQANHLCTSEQSRIDSGREWIQNRRRRLVDRSPRSRTVFNAAQTLISVWICHPQNAPENSPNRTSLNTRCEAQVIYTKHNAVHNT